MATANDGSAMSDTPYTHSQKGSQGSPRPLIQKKEEKENDPSSSPHRSSEVDPPIVCITTPYSPERSWVEIQWLRSKLVPDSATDTAETLTVERMVGYCDGPHVKEKLNQLIDAHNRLARLKLNAPVSVGKDQDLTLGVPQLTRREIDGLTVLLMQWGWRCMCVAPATILRGHLVMCKECGKPVPPDDGD